MKRLALTTLFVLLCGIAGTSARHDEATSTSRHHGAIASGLTAEECNSFSIGGKVFICHATQSAQIPHVLLRVSVEACVEAHADHPDDFVLLDENAEDCGAQ